MNYKYYRDLKHNYLVVKNEDKNIGENEYQLKIVESGRLTGLLPCNIRNINGEQFLYYEIGDLQSLRDRYSSRGMNRAQQLQLFSDMKAMLECLSEYLLGEEGVVFNADSIFLDLSTGQHSFMFCPFAAKEGSFEKLTEELLDLTGSEDDEAATAIYELCEYASGKGAMTMEGIERMLKVTNASFAKEQEALALSQHSEASFHEEEILMEDEDTEDEEEEENEVKGIFGKRIYGNSGIKKSEKKLSGKVQLMLAGLFVALVGVMVYVRLEFILTKQENIMSMVVMAISLVCGALSLVGGLRTLSGKKELSKEHSEAEEECDDCEDCEDEEDGFDYNYEEPEENRDYRTPLRITAVSGANDDFSDNRTMVLDMEDESGGVLNLYSRNLDKTIRIGLDKLPITIGKMEGCVDRVLKDMSVSRIHCRIIREEETGRIALIDLNSTNGTFRNGLRLQPREKNYIEEGDEVRIGRICFDCR